MSRARALTAAGVVLPGSFFHDEASLNPSEICSKAVLLNYSCHLIFCWDIMTEYQTFQRPKKLVEMIVPKLLDMLRHFWQL